MYKQTKMLLSRSLQPSRRDAANATLSKMHRTLSGANHTGERKVVGPSLAHNNLRYLESSNSSSKC
jgi:hypothetical protein